MACIIQLRRDTATNWTTADPVLAAGEIGYDTTNGDFKIGDGVTAWSSLLYYSVAASTYTDEDAQDAIGTILTDSASIDFTYDDGTPSITAVVLPAGVDHDSLNNFVGNEHIDHSSVTVTGTDGLEGGGDLTTSRTINMPDVGTAGSYGSATEVAVITTDAKGRVSGVVETAIAIPSTAITDFVEAVQDAAHAAWDDTTSIDIDYDDTSNTITATVLPAGVNHDLLQNFVANEHIDHTTVQITGADGLTGGGDISNDRTITMPDVGTAGTYGDANTIPQITTDAKGRVTAVTEVDVEIMIADVDGLQEELDGKHSSHGFENPSTTIVLTYSSSTRKITLTPTGSDFSYYINGIKYTISGALESPVHAATTGSYYFTIDASKEISVSSTVWDLLDTSYIPVAYVYYNATLSDGLCLYELHDAERNLQLHDYLHKTRGTVTEIHNGFDLSGYVLNQGDNAGVTFALSGGTIFDEDIQLYISGVSDNGPYTIYNRIGSDNWTWTETSTVPYFVDTNIIQFNEDTGGGVFALSDVPVNEYVNYYVLATTAIQNAHKIFLVAGQTTYSSLSDSASEIFFDLNLGNVPATEVAQLWRLTYQRNATSTADGDAILVAILDLTGGVGAAGGSHQEHNALSGRDVVDSHPYTAITDFDEGAQDAIGTILVDTDTIDFTYNDGTPSITADVQYQMSIVSDASGIKLQDDVWSPGAIRYYGTNLAGDKGWYDLKETAQDAVGDILYDTDTTNVVYQDSTPSIEVNVTSQMSITNDSFGIKLDGDIASPGNRYFYATNDSGTKGWFQIDYQYIVGFTEQVQDDIGTILVDTDTIDFTYNDGTPSIVADVRYQMSITSDASGIKLVNDESTPGNLHFYATNDSGTKGWYNHEEILNDYFYRKDEDIVVVEPYVLNFTGTSRESILVGAESTTDSYWYLVTALLHCEGTNGSTTITDSSKYERTSDISCVYDAQISTADSIYGSASVLLDGTQDYVNLAYNPGVDSDIDWCIEGWFKETSNGNYGLFQWKPDFIGGAFLNALNLQSDNTLDFVLRGSIKSSTDATVPDNTWFHVALTKQGWTYRIFLNGTLKTTYVDTSEFEYTLNDDFRIGHNYNVPFTGFNGYFDEIRITSGYHRYDTSFIAPVAAFPDVPNYYAIGSQTNTLYFRSASDFAWYKGGVYDADEADPGTGGTIQMHLTENGNLLIGESTDNGTDRLQINSAIECTGIRIPGDVQGEILYNDGSTYVSLATGTAGQVLETQGASANPKWSTLDSSYISDFDEAVQDTIGTILVDTDTIDFTYDDGTPNITADVRYQMSITSDASGIKFVNDEAAPGNLHFYATNVSGTKGWYNHEEILNDYFYRKDEDIIIIDPYKIYFESTDDDCFTAIKFGYDDDGTDPNWDNVTLLLHFEQPTGQEYQFHDSSNYSRYVSVGYATISSAQKKFGTTSAYFDGTNTYLSWSDQQIINTGTGDLTIEGWFRIDNLTEPRPFFAWKPVSASTPFSNVWVETNGTLKFEFNSTTQGSTDIASSSGAIVAATWHHIALTRASGTWRLFLDGTQVGSNYVDATSITTELFYLGGGVGGGLSTRRWLGYIDEFRITKGIARYTSNFTAPTVAFSDVDFGSIGYYSRSLMFKAEDFFRWTSGDAGTETMLLRPSGELNIQGGIDIPNTTTGDVLYHNGTYFTRLAPGTSGYVLTTNGAGLAPEWKPATLPPIGGRISGRYYDTLLHSTDAGDKYSCTADYVTIIPYIPNLTWSFDRIGVFMEGGAGTGSANVAVYDTNTTTGYPGTRLVITGNINLDVGNSVYIYGIRSLTFTAGLVYWIAIHTNRTIDVSGGKFSNGYNFGILNNTVKSQDNHANILYSALTFGAGGTLPTNWTFATSQLVYNNNIPAPRMRAA